MTLLLAAYLSVGLLVLWITLRSRHQAQWHTPALRVVGSLFAVALWPVALVLGVRHAVALLRRES